MTPLTKILTPTGMLGYGYPEQDFWDAVRAGVDAIVVDSGSTDPGPYLLALGATLCTEQSYLRDLRPMLKAVHQYGIPLFIGSAGGAGTRAQVDQMVNLVDRIATEEGFGLRVAAIYADIPPYVAAERLAAGQIAPMCAEKRRAPPISRPARRWWRRWARARSPTSSATTRRWMWWWPDALMILPRRPLGP